MYDLSIENNCIHYCTFPGSFEKHIPNFTPRTVLKSMPQASISAQGSRTFYGGGGGGAPSRESVETSTGVWLTGDTSLESPALNPRGGGGVGLVFTCVLSHSYLF